MRRQLVVEGPLCSNCLMKSEAALRERFDRFDADQNGAIDSSEFKNLIRSLGLSMTDTKAARAFLALDINQNGVIEYGEFHAWWTKYDRP